MIEKWWCVIHEPYTAKIPHLYSGCQVFGGFFSSGNENNIFHYCRKIFSISDGRKWRFFLLLMEKEVYLLPERIKCL